MSEISNEPNADKAAPEEQVITQQHQQESHDGDTKQHVTGETAPKESQTSPTADEQSCRKDNRDDDTKVPEPAAPASSDDHKSEKSVKISVPEKTDVIQATDVIEAASEKESVELEKAEHKVSVGTSTVPTETPEVSSTKNDDHHHHSKPMISSRRPSYNSSRGYGGSYQNYGLTYLPYKSNFEPSEDARRRADEFFKTLKL